MYKIVHDLYLNILVVIASVENCIQTDNRFMLERVFPYILLVFVQRSLYKIILKIVDREMFGNV